MHFSTHTPGKKNIWSRVLPNRDHLLLALFAIGPVCLLTWLLQYSKYGLDLTDEGFYLLWMANPFLYDWSITQFGFLYHPLYLMLDGNIPVLRQVNILITFTLAWILTYAVLIQLNNANHPRPGIHIVLAGGLAPGSLLVFYPWLLTPSYNSLNLQALLITATGLALAQKVRNRSSMLGWILIGLGGGLCFMAKPSSAAVLTVIACSYLLVSQKMCVLSLAAVATATTILTVCALIIDGSIVKFAIRIATAIEMIGLLDGGHQLGRMLRLDDIQLNTGEKLVLSVTTGLTACSLFLASCLRVSARRAGLFIACMFLLPVLVFRFAPGVVHFETGEFRKLILLAIPLAALLSGLIRHRQNPCVTIPCSHWALAITLAVLPYSYAFGTNNNYWCAAGSAGIFWLLAGVILSIPRVQGRLYKHLLPQAFATQFLVALVLHASMERPYRQSGQLWEYAYHLNIGGPGSTLLVGGEQGRYLEEAAAAAREAGFQSGDPVIDLTGRSPGILYALKSSAVGQPWIIGGYPGSAKAAIAILTRTVCATTANAWVLTEPTGPRQIAETALSPMGIELENHYEQAASWHNAGESEGPRDQRQILWKPTREPVLALQACLRKQHEHWQRVSGSTDTDNR